MKYLLPALLLLCLAVPVAAEKLERDPPEGLAETYVLFLLAVDVLMTDDEWRGFVALGEDYQRDAFIEKFWQQRDEEPRTSRNEFRERFEVRLEQANLEFGDLKDSRARWMLLNGPPDEREKIVCADYTWPLDIWFYDALERYEWPFALVFYKKWGVGNWRAWDPWEGSKALLDDMGRNNAPRSQVDQISYGGAPLHCNLEVLARALKQIAAIQQSGSFVYEKLMARLQKRELPASDEWVRTFTSYTTDLPDQARILPSELDFAFPAWSGNRILVQGLLTIQAADVTLTELKGAGSYNLVVNGEVLKARATGGEELFDSFRLRFDFSAEEVADLLPLVFERYLRPGEYRIIVRVEDMGKASLSAPHMARHEVDLSVPRVDRATVPNATLSPQGDRDPEIRQVLDEAYRAIASGEAALEIQRPFGDLLTGLQRFETLAIGDNIDKVIFTVDGREQLTKKQPPYSVELDLGHLPQTRVLRVAAYDIAGEEIASDELLLNASPHRFSVRLVEPIAGKTYRRGLRARADVSLPEGETLERVEFYRGDERLVTLYQAPFTHPMKLTDAGIDLVRVAAYLTDGTLAEDVVLVNSPTPSEEVDVDFVELYTSVVDGQKRPVLGLTEANFTVYEDGAPQTVQRFERVDNLPIHATILLDISASMEERLLPARDAALDFFEEIVTPRDRLAAITFNDHPIVAASFTSEIRQFARGLAGLKAERGTALYDSLIFSLFYTNGLPGQRAILLLSDGVDESSRFTLGETVEYLQRSGVTVYSIGLGLKGEGRRTLKRFAEETGGQSFFLDDVSGLPEVYKVIREELRTKYLLAYQSTGGDNRSFRRVEVEVSKSGLKARTIRGYFP